MHKPAPLIQIFEKAPYLQVVVAMSCTSFEPQCDRDLSASSSGAACRSDPPEEEEDRLSTAAPSICEEATTRWADMLDSHKRWADLIDSDEEDLKCVPPVQSTKAKKRWADLADESDELDGTVSTQSPDEPETEEPETGHFASTPSAGYDTGDASSWRPKRSGKSAGKGHGASTSYSQHAHGSWGSMQWRPREEQVKPSYTEGHRSSNWGGDSWGAWNERPERTSKGKGKGKGKGKAAGKSSNHSASKCQCQFIIGIEEESRFRVCRRLLGPAGQHMKDIAQGTGAKLRLRGRGSKFLEGPEQKESADPLMLCVSAPDNPSYEEAKCLISSLLEDIYTQYNDFQRSAGSKPVDLRINLHEGPRPGSF